MHLELKSIQYWLLLPLQTLVQMKRNLFKIQTLQERRSVEAETINITIKLFLVLFWRFLIEPTIAA